MPLKPIAKTRFVSGAVGWLALKSKPKWSALEQAVLNPWRAVDMAEIACGDFSNLIVVCSRFRADIEPQLAHDALTSADLERDG